MLFFTKKGYTNYSPLTILQNKIMYIMLVVTAERFVC